MNSLPYQCEMQADGEPFLYPNEEIYTRTNDVAFLDETQNVKIYEGTAMVTTHRIIYIKDNKGLQVPIAYIKKYEKEGGLFSNPRIEVHIDQIKLQQKLMYISEYYTKILEKPVPDCKVDFGSTIQVHIRKFPNKDSRENFYKMLNEAAKQGVWLKPIQSQKA